MHGRIDIVTESVDTTMDGSLNRDGGVAPWQWAVVCLAVFLVRILPWATAELWYDEIITLGDFAVGPSGSGIVRVFRSYPVANNHMVFSAIAWWWVRFTGFTSVEYLLRFPSMVFGGASIVLILFWWRRFLGVRGAYLAGITVAISSVFGAFAYQFRGYGLTMMLTVAAVTGLMETVRGQVRRGLWLQLPALFLLPLVIPSNVFLAASHALFLLIWTSGPLSGRRRVGLAFLVGGAGLLGLAYYGTIWDQFVRVMRQTSGWPSGIQVVGNLLLGFAVHLGIFSLFVPVAIWQSWRREVPDSDVRRAGLYAVSLFVPILATILVSGHHVPYPRVYLAALLPLTFAAVLAAKNGRIWQRLPLLSWAGIILAVGFGAERLSTWHTRVALQRGEHPQNLVEQYYRGSVSLRGLAARLAGTEEKKHLFILTNAYDYPTFRFYWSQHGLPISAVCAENLDPKAAWQEARLGSEVFLCVLARDELAAARLFAAAGETGSFQRWLQVGERSIWVLAREDRMPPNP